MEPVIKEFASPWRRFWAKNTTIPVIVDNIINLPDFNMIRFVYFSIDATENPKPIGLKINGQKIPFLLIGFQGIIHAPLKGTRFLTSGAIRKLFDSIETSMEFFVDTNDIWFPVSIFPEKPSRGEVYRITREFFNLALRYRHDRMELDEFNPLAQKYKGQLYHSVNESRAFDDWSKSIIKEAKGIYPKNANMKLQLNSKYQ
jgi:hypothetical protein